MSEVYFALELMGAMIILVILYANHFELKQRTKKSNLFSILLISNFVVVAVDALTWMKVNWENAPWLLWVLVTLTYVLPSLMTAIFARYLYLHISDRTEVSRTPFYVIDGLAVAVCVTAFIMCLSGTMFEIQGGKFYPLSGETTYYLLYILITLCLACVVFLNHEKLGIHDFIASLSFSLVPLISIIITISGMKINLAIPGLAVTMLLIYIMLQSDAETRLIRQSYNDKLTGLFNRRAYEDDLLHYQHAPVDRNFVYASIDVNGLKVVNDTLGHAAGDELLSGASYCLSRTFGNYGKVYRTGGDEFAAMFIADDAKLEFLLDDLKDVTNEWHGSIVDAVSVSVGVVKKAEYPDMTVEEVAKIADERMYEEKARYYANKGIDRRGQSEAHKVLCSLYTKILKINLTEDNYAVINLAPDEQPMEERISAWFSEFGKSGGVHPDDLEEYLAKTNLDYMRSYFISKKAPLYVIYRRKYENTYKKVLMEIVPTKEYSDENQSLFLYVKNIES